MTPSLISAMTTAEAVAAMLDADRLSERLQRPVRAARLRIKPEVSVLVSLTDRSTGLTAGWAPPPPRAGPPSCPAPPAP